MDKFIIQGKTPLNGEINISGSKNGVLPLMAATLLTRGTSVITNSPHLKDIKTMSDVFRVIGARVEGEKNTLRIDTTSCSHFEAPYELVKTMRASIYVLGPLLAKYGRVRVSLPGGCAWGPRPVDIHIKGMLALGAKVHSDHGYIEATAKRLKGTTFKFDIVSVGATANILMAASLAKGSTRLINTAKEPEITLLVEYLNRMGAKIEETHDGIEVEGVDELYPANIETISDRIEAGTFLAAVAGAGGKVTLGNLNIPHLDSVLDVLEETGVKITRKEKSIIVESSGILKSVNVDTSPYPGYPTDMQAQLMAILSVAKGTSIITENIYPDRFTHVPELCRLGADITLKNNVAIIKGGKKLYGAQVMATDLRASAALVIAGIMAEGTTEVSRVYHIDRGYEQIEAKLKMLGANIERVREEF